MNQFPQPLLEEARDDAVDHHWSEGDYEDDCCLQHDSFVLAVPRILCEGNAGKEDKGHSSADQPADKDDMELFVVDVHPLVEDLSAEPSEHIGIEEASEAKDEHYNGKEYIRMRNIVRVTVRRLPLSLADHYAHDEEKQPLAHIGQYGENVYWASMALFTHVVKVVVVQQDSIEKKADGPRKAKQFGKDIGDEANDEQKASLRDSFVLRHEPHPLWKIDGEDRTKSACCNWAKNEDNEVQEHLEESVPVDDELIRRLVGLKVQDGSKEHNGHCVFHHIFAKDDRVKPRILELRNRLLWGSCIDAAQTGSEEQDLPVGKSAHVVNVIDVDNQVFIH